MRAELKGLDSTDTGVDPNGPGFSLSLEEWQPSDKFDFGILVSAQIGTEGEAGADLFYFMVCSPRWLGQWLDGQIELEFTRALTRGRMTEIPFQFVRGDIVLREWNFSRVQEIIRNLCSQTTGPDWHSITRRLSRFGDWEFEGMDGDE